MQGTCFGSAWSLAWIILNFKDIDYAASYPTTTLTTRNSMCEYALLFFSFLSSLSLGSLFHQIILSHVSGHFHHSNFMVLLSSPNLTSYFLTATFCPTNLLDFELLITSSPFPFSGWQSLFVLNSVLSAFRFLSRGLDLQWHVIFLEFYMEMILIGEGFLPMIVVCLLVPSCFLFFGDYFHILFGYSGTYCII